MANGILEEYDLTTAEQLFESFTEQSTFAEMELLKQKINDEIAVIKSTIEINLARCKTLKTRVASEEMERKQAGFFNRLFASRAEYDRMIKTIEQIENQIATLESVIEALESRAGICPTNREEKKAIITTLRQRKKELALEKKERNLEMQKIRTGARKSQASLGYAGYGKMARYTRASVRADKESKIAPHEAEKQRLDRMIVELDRLILCVERIAE